jgi:hypothetical protein
VVFDDGLELAIPNELLVVPERLIDDSGEVQLDLCGSSDTAD